MQGNKRNIAWWLFVIAMLVGVSGIALIINGASFKVALGVFFVIWAQNIAHNVRFIKSER
jgi:hypothetical protein